MALAAEVMGPDGRLILYGPYLEAEVPTAPRQCKPSTPTSGRRDPGLGASANLAEGGGRGGAGHGLALSERIAMPANNLIVVFSKA